MPHLEDGHFLVALRCLSIDVAMRSWMLADHSYLEQIEIGDVVRACGFGQIIESRHPAFEIGAYVLGAFGAQECAVSDGAGAVCVPVGTTPVTRWAGSLGLTVGLTAYLGLIKVGKPKRGQTLLVSGASGAVGSIVGQIGRIEGCKVVGVAGGPDKCRRVVEDLGFDLCLDYRADDLAAQLHAACPDRVDLLFDNTGGEVLDHALAWMKPHGRVVLCGTTAARTSGQPSVIANARSIIIDRLALTGFILFDHIASYGEAVSQLSEWHESGRIKVFSAEEVVEGGLEQLLPTLKRVVEGKNSSKVVLTL